LDALYALLLLSYKQNDTASNKEDLPAAFGANNPTNPFNFVKSILDLAQNKDLQRILGQNGLEIIEKYYTKEIIINKYLNLFLEL
jgi:glycosyltransferase involved in cell wall biosynthesis